MDPALGRRCVRLTLRSAQSHDVTRTPSGTSEPRERDSVRQGSSVEAELAKCERRVVGKDVELDRPADEEDRPCRGGNRERGQEDGRPTLAAPAVNAPGRNENRGGDG